MDSDPLDVVLQVTRALDELGIPYLIGGSVASSYYAPARATYDVDLVADVRLAHVQPLCAALEAGFYIAAEAVTDAIARGGSFNVIHLETALKVDIFVVGREPFERTQLSRRVARAYRDCWLYYATAEDVVLAKLRWYRLTGDTSERQWTDLCQVLRAQRDALDLPYLHHTAADLGVTDLLDRALAEAAT